MPVCLMRTDSNCRDCSLRKMCLRILGTEHLYAQRVCAGMEVIMIKLDSKKLKIMAVAFMLVDHVICQSFGPDYFTVSGRIVYFLSVPFDNYPNLYGLADFLTGSVSFLIPVLGRAAAVLFFFLLAEGFTHTRSVKKYILRLLGFGVLAQFGYVMFDEGRLAFEWGMRLNIMFTMAAALFALWCAQKLKGRPWFAVPAIAAITVLTVILDLEYSYECIIYVFFFYYGKRLNPYLRGILGIALAWALQLYRFGDLLSEGGMRAFRLIAMYAVGHSLAILLTLKYNGEKGKQPKGFQYFFYAFYPAHLLILGIIQAVLYHAA